MQTYTYDQNEADDFNRFTEIYLFIINRFFKCENE